MILTILLLVALAITLGFGYYTNRWVPFYVVVAIGLGLVIYKGVQ